MSDEPLQTLFSINDPDANDSVFGDDDELDEELQGPLTDYHITGIYAHKSYFERQVDAAGGDSRGEWMAVLNYFILVAWPRYAPFTDKVAQNYGRFSFIQVCLPQELKNLCPNCLGEVVECLLCRRLGNALTILHDACEVGDCTRIQFDMESMKTIAQMLWKRFNASPNGKRKLLIRKLEERVARGEITEAQLEAEEHKLADRLDPARIKQLKEDRVIYGQAYERFIGPAAMANTDHVNKTKERIRNHHIKERKQVYALAHQQQTTEAVQMMMKGKDHMVLPPTKDPKLIAASERKARIDKAAHDAFVAAFRKPLIEAAAKRSASSSSSSSASFSPAVVAAATKFKENPIDVIQRFDLGTATPLGTKPVYPPPPPPLLSGAADSVAVTPTAMTESAQKKRKTIEFIEQPSSVAASAVVMEGEEPASKRLRTWQLHPRIPLEPNDLNKPMVQLRADATMIDSAITEAYNEMEGKRRSFVMLPTSDIVTKLQQQKKKRNVSEEVTAEEKKDIANQLRPRKQKEIEDVVWHPRVKDTEDFKLIAADNECCLMDRYLQKVEESKSLQELIKHVEHVNAVQINNSQKTHYVRVLWCEAVHVHYEIWHKENKDKPKKDWLTTASPVFSNAGRTTLLAALRIAAISRKYPMFRYLCTETYSISYLETIAEPLFKEMQSARNKDSIEFDKIWMTRIRSSSVLSAASHTPSPSPYPHPLAAAAITTTTVSFPLVIKPSSSSIIVQQQPTIIAATA